MVKHCVSPCEPEKINSKEQKESNRYKKTPLIYDLRKA
jgi:hypothetical protein